MRVDSRIAPIRRDQIVHIGLLVPPFPRRDHDIALHVLRPRRRGLRQLAPSQAVGPLAKSFQRCGTEEAGLASHFLPGQPGLKTPYPSLVAGFKHAELCRDSAGSFLSKLMAADAADVLHLA